MKRLTIALAGLEQSDVDLVRDALDRHDLAPWQLHEDPTADGADAELLIVDVDSVWGHMDWLKSTARGQRTVGYSNQPSAHEGDLMLVKPLVGEHLAQLLQALIEDGTGFDSASYAASHPHPHEGEAGQVLAPPSATSGPTAHAAQAPLGAAAATDPGAMPAHRSDGEDDSTGDIDDDAATMAETVGEWLLTGASTTPFVLHDGDQRLLVDPQLRSYRGTSQLKPLIPMLKLSPGIMQTPHAADLATLDDAGQPIDRLFWLAALIATPGQLSTRHDSATTFRLDRWPQIEREFPRHFRIATAMMKQPGSLGELASAANTPEADVADFINAYAATGYVIASDEDDDAMAKSRPRLRNLFARVASR